MPTYDYRCENCQRQVTLFLSYDEYGRKKVFCPECGSAKLRRRIGRIRVARSEESRLDSLADPGNFGDLDENDPKSMARMMRKMSAEMGEDMGPEFGEAMDRLEAGESPEEVEKSMPEMAGGGEDDFGE